MARILCNFDVASLYPTLVRIFGYSSRNQKDKNKYIETLDMRLDAKYKRTAQEILDSLSVTYDDLNKGLKLPINAYTGALRATFNALYDPLQGFSIWQYFSSSKRSFCRVKSMTSFVSSSFLISSKRSV